MQPVCISVVWPRGVFSGLGHPGPRGSVWTWGAPLLSICHLPCQPGFCMHLLLPPAPKAASSTSLRVDLWCRVLSLPSPGSCMPPGMLSAFWLPMMPPHEMSPCTDSRTPSWTFSICLGCLREQRHYGMGPL